MTRRSPLNAQRGRGLIGQSLLLVVATTVSLLAGEVLTRWSDGQPLTRLALRPGSGARATALEPGLEDTEVVVARLPIAPGTNRRWFAETPPPLANRRPVSPEYQALEAQVYGRPMASFDMFKLWNSRFVRDELCTKADGGYFAGFPSVVFAFEPTDGKPLPRYRYLPSTTTPLGLVTNRFGLRGEDIEFRRPPEVVRVAFLGASTTVEMHGSPHAYPEFVGHWLNLWSRARRLGVRFEILNAGREGVASGDIAAIFHQEVAPLDPDLVVYYEGSNQFGFRDLIRGLEGRDPRREPRALWWEEEPRFSRYSALGRRAWGLLRDALSTRLAEPPKPKYRLRWPKGLDEADPDVERRPLPLSLGAILDDLERIRRDSENTGATLVMTSFLWMVWDGMVLDATRQPSAQHYLDYLNNAMAPYRYADIRRMADFQNRVFRRYASLRGLPFIEVDGLFPREPRYFFDPIHTLPNGSRLRAWIVFQGLIPVIDAQLRSGRLPRPARAAAEHPVLGSSGPLRLGFEEVRTACRGRGR